MTLEEQIMKLQTYKMFEGEDTVYVERDDVLKLLEQEPCEDCISRAELLKAVDTWDKFGCDADTKLVPVKDCYVPYIHYDDVVKSIKGMPNVQPKTGRWIRKTVAGCFVYGCNQCGWQQTYATDFCPDCKARMVESQESEDE